MLWQYWRLSPRMAAIRIPWAIMAIRIPCICCWAAIICAGAIIGPPGVIIMPGRIGPPGGVGPPGPRIPGAII